MNRRFYETPSFEKQKRILYFPKLADVANNTIIKIEQGENINPTLDTLRKVAKALDVSVDELIQ